MTLPPSSHGAAVTARGVTFRYAGADGRTLLALDGVDLDVGAGEPVSVVGPFGCGKSTLLRLVAGFLPAQTGEVNVLGATPADAQRAHALGLVGQDPGLRPWRDVEVNVRLPLDVMRANDAPRVRALLDQAGVADFAEYRPAVRGHARGSHRESCRPRGPRTPMIQQQRRRADGGRPRTYRCRRRSTGSMGIGTRAGCSARRSIGSAQRLPSRRSQRTRAPGTAPTEAKRMVCPLAMRASHLQSLSRLARWSGGYRHRQLHARGGRCPSTPRCASGQTEGRRSRGQRCGR
ncbi:MAG: ATP-binding cassette domain-containing protein [Dehalococcoidia bacterium]|nr:ATP-binding cassette domain-containing protein [Dehalococcoidia bacterium]